MDEKSVTSEIAIVIIGRNEGARLIRCLQSIGPDYKIVYVDSGSTDQSVEMALQYSAQVVSLEMGIPFTAARARNAGLAMLGTQYRLVQFIDGDCILQPGWIDAAKVALAQDERLAAVFGRRREIAPEASIYNWMCDLEWAVKPGPTRYFGGDVMLRRAALDQAGGYPAGMIAGEEPDVGIRLRNQGWRLACLPHEMTLHDANIMRFSQWWRRSMRSGHAFAELAARHSDRALSDYRRRLLGVLWWGAALPVCAVIMLLFAIVLSDLVLAAAAIVLSFLPIAQLVRLALREKPLHGYRRATMLATFLMLAKPAQAIGFVRYWSTRLLKKQASIIEYKGAPV